MNTIINTIKNNKIKISVITSTYNSSNVLQRCIDSVYYQTYKNKEHIIIDGASTDNTLELIKKNEYKLHYWKSEPDNGVYEAWNKAISCINGDWVIFLGADDFLFNEYVFEKAVPYLDRLYPKYNIIYGIMAINNNNTILSYGVPWLDLKKRINLARYGLPPHPATFQHKSLFNSKKVFDETYKIAADSKFLAEAIQNKDPIFIPVEISVFSTGGISGSLGKKQLQIWWEELRVSKDTNNYIPVFILIKNFIKALVKNLTYILFKEKGVKILLCVVNVIKSYNSK